MSDKVEEKKFEEKKVAAPTVPLSPEALAAAQAKALEETLAKLPSHDDLQKEMDALDAKKKELARLQDVKANFGRNPDGSYKPGKKLFNLPKMPKALGRISVNGEVLEGHKMLTFEQYESYLFMYNNRLELESKMRYGDTVADKELRAMVGGDVQVSRTGEQATFK